MKQNDYGSLCTEMYEILHPEAPEDELDFYLSYGEKGKKILELLCGSGRFLIPFLERGFDICGMDASGEMLARLKQKAPQARAVQADIAEYVPEEKYDYIFISSGSVSLFTDMAACKAILGKVRQWLAPGGKFVFAVDTVACRCPEDKEEKTAVSVKTRDGLDLLLINKDHYEEATQTQYSPSRYALYDGGRLIRSEPMDFQTHLYRLGEMEQMLSGAGFPAVKVYSGYGKEIARDESTEMFLYECGVPESPVTDKKKGGMEMLRSERLIFRQIGDSDFDTIARIMRDEGVRKVWGHWFTDEDVRNWIARRKQGYRENGIDYLLAVDRKTGEAVGQMGLLKEQIGEETVWGIGYILLDRFRGKGYATEGAKAMADHAFHDLGISRLVCDIRPMNTASIAVAKRLGMTETGVFVKHYHGMEMPHLIFELDNPRK